MSQIARLNDFGQSPWYDNITHTLVTGGGLAALVRDDGIRGVSFSLRMSRRMRWPISQ